MCYSGTTNKRIKTERCILLCILSAVLLWSSETAADDDRALVMQTLAVPFVNGGDLYKKHCKTCHEQQGMVQTKAGKSSFKPNNSNKYYPVIANGKAPNMPAWKQTLSKKNIKDILSYLDVINQAEKRGEVVYKINCILCHGVRGDGNGRAAKMYKQRPSNLIKSTTSDDYKTSITKLGGKAVNASAEMPAWNAVLSDKEISDVVIYMKTLMSKK